MLLVPACGPVNVGVKCFHHIVRRKSGVNFRGIKISFCNFVELRKTLPTTESCQVRWFVYLLVRLALLMAAIINIRPIYDNFRCAGQR